MSHFVKHRKIVYKPNLIFCLDTFYTFPYSLHTTQNKMWLKTSLANLIKCLSASKIRPTKWSDQSFNHHKAHTFKLKKELYLRKDERG